MKQKISILALFLLVAGFNSCTKDDTASANQGLSKEIKDRITALGFDASEAYAADGGYIVEGDIFLSEADLTAPVGDIQTLLIANNEQYRTTNLVTGLPRTITVSMSGTYNANTSSAVDNALARYNAKNLQITFLRVSSGGDINVKIVNGGNYIASSGFPSGGDPYGEVKFNKQYQNWTNNTLTSVMAHEIGHCIGFRHTDYMDRSYSCGGAPSNEGSAGIGAILIPGTPSGPDAGSWMLACIGNGVNRPFNNNDVTALNYLY